MIRDQNNMMVGIGTLDITFPHIIYPSYPIQYYPYPSTLNRLGEFDLHLDSCGNLRIIRAGVLLATFEAGK